jgi:site-specific DNA recombinase
MAPSERTHHDHPRNPHPPADVWRQPQEQALLPLLRHATGLRDTIRAGMDPELAAAETRKIQADIATAEAIIERWERSTDRPRPLTEADVRTALTGAGGFVGLLGAADRTERAALYRALGGKLTYERQTTGQEVVRARLQLGGGGGGGI